MSIKFRVVVVVGGGLLDFKVYLSPLLGEGVRSRIERCLREGSRDVRERVPREGERGESERGRGKRRERRGDRLRQFETQKSVVLSLGGLQMASNDLMSSHLDP